jgi:hypothetical protein
MPIEVTESMSCERIPHDDMSLFSTTSNESML